VYRFRNLRCCIISGSQATSKKVYQLLGIRYFRANIMLLLLYIARSLSTSHNALRLLCVLILCVGNDLPLYNMANPRLQHFSDRPEKSREIGAFSCDISNPETLSDLNRGDQGVCERDQKSWFCSTIFLRWLIFHIGGQQGGQSSEQSTLGSS